jgi:hypothetical protein
MPYVPRRDQHAQSREDSECRESTAVEDSSIGVGPRMRTKDASTYGWPIVNGNVIGNVNGTRVVIDPARCPAGPGGGNHSLEARLSSLDIIGIRL